MKQRPRSKQELLNQRRAYEALHKDREMGDNIAGKAAYWRPGVEWCTVLRDSERFSANEISKFLGYMESHRVTDMTEEHRTEVNRMLEGCNIQWRLRNMAPIGGRNAIEREVNELTRFNTEAHVDYSLLACEYLHYTKGYAKKRLNRVISLILMLDRNETEGLFELRQRLFDKTGIWLKLTDGDMPPDESIEGRDKKYIGGKEAKGQ